MLERVRPYINLSCESKRHQMSEERFNVTDYDYAFW